MTDPLYERIKEIVREYGAKQEGYGPSLDQTVNRIIEEIHKSERRR